MEIPDKQYCGFAAKKQSLPLTPRRERVDKNWQKETNKPVQSNHYRRGGMKCKGKVQIDTNGYAPPLSQRSAKI